MKTIRRLFLLLLCGITLLSAVACNGTQPKKTQEKTNNEESEENNYAGEYKGIAVSSLDETETLTILPGGKYISKIISDPGKNSGNNTQNEEASTTEGNAPITSEDAASSEGGQYSVREEHGSWKAVDGYVVFEFESADRKYYLKKNNELLRTEETGSRFRGQQYELKGGYLYNINRNNKAEYQKVS